MVDLIKNEYGTLSPIFQIATIKLKDMGTLLQVRDGEDSVFKRIQAADPSSDDDLVTRRNLVAVTQNFNNVWQFDFVNIGINATTTGVMSGGVVYKSGEIVGIGIFVDQPRTAGTATAYATLNGVAQNGVGQYVVIDGNNTVRNWLAILTPMQYSAGISLGARIVTSGFNPNNTGAVVTIFTRDR